MLQHELQTRVRGLFTTSYTLMTARNAVSNGEIVSDCARSRYLGTDIDQTCEPVKTLFSVLGHCKTGGNLFDITCINGCGSSAGFLLWLKAQCTDE